MAEQVYINERGEYYIASIPASPNDAIKPHATEEFKQFLRDLAYPIANAKAHDILLDYSNSGTTTQTAAIIENNSPELHFDAGQAEPTNDPTANSDQSHEALIGDNDTV